MSEADEVPTGPTGHEKEFLAAVPNLMKWGPQWEVNRTQILIL